MPRRRALLDWDKATLALVIVGSVMALEVVGYIVMVSLGYTVPDAYLSFMLSTLTGLLAMGGAQYINGKLAGGAQQ